MSQEHDASAGHSARQRRYEQKLRSVDALDEEVFELRSILRDVLLAKGLTEKADLALVERGKPRRVRSKANPDKKAFKKAQRASLLAHRRSLLQWLKQEKIKLTRAIEKTKAAQPCITSRAMSEIFEMLEQEGYDSSEWRYSDVADES